MKDTAIDNFFSVLGNKQRVRILQYLHHANSESVGEICRALDLEQSAVSHNMKRLLDWHFVEMEPHGKERRYRMSSQTVTPLFDLIDQHIRLFCVDGCQH